MYLPLLVRFAAVGVGRRVIPVPGRSAKVMVKMDWGATSCSYFTKFINFACMEFKYLSLNYGFKHFIEGRVGCSFQIN